MTATKLKTIIYTSAAAVGCIIAALVSGLGFDVGLLYAVFYGLFGAAAAAIIARIAYHIATDDYGPAMWQISIYLMISAGGWLGAVLAESWGAVSISLAVMVSGILMAVGTRFILKPSIVPADDGETSVLATTLRYRYIGDKPDGTLNLDAPLCLVKGTAMTVEEAFTAGATEEAKAGLAYIKKITGGK